MTKKTKNDKNTEISMCLLGANTYCETNPSGGLKDIDVNFICVPGGILLKNAPNAVN